MGTFQNPFPPAWAARVESELKRSDLRAQDLIRGLNPQQLNWKISPESWSIGQCVKHLSVFNDVYLRAMFVSLEGQRTSVVQEIAPGWVARWFIRTYVDPSPAGKRAAAPKKVEPGEAINQTVLDDFVRSNQGVADLIQKAGNYDVNAIRFRNPFFPIVRFTVGAGVEILWKHEVRHLLQAERVRKHPDFPGPQ